MPSTRLISEICLPASLRPSVLNSMVELGARRSALPSSNSTSARPFWSVFKRVPCVIGRLRKAFSNPRPVFLSIWTVPCTSLRRTMRACDSARAGSASSAPTATARRIELNLERDALDIATPGRLLTLLEHGLGAKVVNVGLSGHGRELRQSNQQERNRRRGKHIAKRCPRRQLLKAVETASGWSNVYWAQISELVRTVAGALANVE